MRGLYAVLEVDEKYSPKVQMYNIASGTVGIMKVRKPTYNKQPLQPGDVIKMDDWVRKQKMQYSDGISKPVPGVYDLWMNSYSLYLS